MRIENVKHGIAIECSKKDICPNIENNSITAVLNGKMFTVARYADYDTMMNAYQHLLRAFKLGEECNIDDGLVYQITEAL